MIQTQFSFYHTILPAAMRACLDNVFVNCHTALVGSSVLEFSFPDHIAVLVYISNSRRGRNAKSVSHGGIRAGISVIW